MNGVSKEGSNGIIKRLKSKKYSVLEINLSYPYEYKICGNV